MLNGHVEIGPTFRTKAVNGHSSKPARKQTAPPKQKGAAASKAGLEQRIVSALRPLLVDDRMDFKFAKGRAEIDAYRALLDVCSAFTVSEAVEAAEVLHPAWVGTCEADPIRYGALYTAEHIFQTFIACARPSSSDCVHALARFLAIHEEDGEQRLAEVHRPFAAATLNEGLAALRANDFSRGERFESGGDGTQGWCKRSIEATRRQKYWHPSSSGNETGAANDPQEPLSPASLVDRLIDAVVPLTNAKGDGLKDRKTKDDVVMVLLPICGQYTVADAVLVVSMLDAAENMIEQETVDSLGRHDSRRSQARYWVWSALVDFACHGWAAGPACASARASMLRRAADPEEYLGDNSYAAIRERIEDDIQALRNGKFSLSDRFGTIEYSDDQLPDWLWRTKQ